MKLIDKVLSIIFPNNCAFCRTGLPHSDSGVYICTECMDKLTFCIRFERCKKCGDKLSSEKYSVCRNCRNMHKDGIPIYFDSITAPIEYNAAAKQAIINLKNGLCLGAVDTFCALIEAMLKSDFADIKFDYIVSVPPRGRRMNTLRFDQAEIIAGRLAKRLGVKYLGGCMKRIRKTKKQSELGYAERRTNLSGAFAVKRYGKRLKDSNVLVIDDVCTTGSTVNECARALKAAGAAHVYGAAIARTFREGGFLN